MPQAHTWQHGSSPHQYTLLSGLCQALVWQQSGRDWGALISRDSTAVLQAYFGTRAEAQTWCEEHLAELQTKGQC
jgi:hypothetical protein